jgi:hypothetical protein
VTTSSRWLRDGRRRPRRAAGGHDGDGYLETALGPALPVVLTTLRMSALKTRDDLRCLAAGLQALGV